MLLRMVLSTLVLFWADAAQAFNALGHKVVAEIAWRQLEPTDRQQIVAVLRRHPRFDADFAAKMTDDVLRGDKAVQDRWIFQQAATWPDLARRFPAGERKKYNRPTWHYVNFPLFLDPSDRRALAPTLPVIVSAMYPTAIDTDDYNVLQAIAYSRAAIDSRAGADVKAVAYCWLFHLVGDLHQPLHSTALFSVRQFPKGDRGGNLIPLTRGRNLHALWDNLLGRRHFLRNVDKEVAELSDRRQYGEVWKSATQEMDVMKWTEESHELAKSFVYSEVILNAVRATPPDEQVKPITLSDAYLREAGHQARVRIIAAGLRLGALLRSGQGGEFTGSQP